ncbi:alpha/beta hydrolase [Seonamhaeicola sediminis]|uniref:Alpha/beta hydrolase n=1 Tax=Seonamhaeicola sediminis TaxID=2528206 RepID=A0A562YCX5_9FLAO|nr:alpha/beta hydrolase [Seonamhaeicola sediminis]TWO31947.1 alpha/beta hydrolase [Seonamhaeicola sediminis]
MSQELIHVYLMPGMAASPLIFENIKLPKDKFKLHYLEWILPVEDELLSDYAIRMTQSVRHENVVLLGVSFGGVLVQEMSKFLKIKKLIIVSSVKSRNEIPKHMQLANSTRAYKLLPTQLASKIDILEKYAFGKNFTKRLKLYKKFLSVNDNKYLSWAIKNMIGWNQQEPIDGIVHIHGDKDPVFPISNINNCITIPNGTHIMIINRYRWFNAHLTDIILEN